MSLTDCNGNCFRIKGEKTLEFHTGQKYCCLCGYYLTTNERFCSCCHCMFRANRRRNRRRQSGKQNEETILELEDFKN
jgi:hypothetical protein